MDIEHVRDGSNRRLPSQRLTHCAIGRFAHLECMMKPFPLLLAAALFVAAPAFAQAPNDAQIAAIVVSANQVDIDAGKLAETRGDGTEVKDFGKDMVADHSAVNKQAEALAKKLELKPEPNATSKSLKAEGDKNIAHLKALKGVAFDKAYIDHEVTYHEQVIDAIKSTLIPNAKNAQLKKLLEDGLPLFEGHLEHAKQIQAHLGK
jgi:putative membrane protein